VTHQAVTNLIVINQTVINQIVTNLVLINQDSSARLPRGKWLASVQP
jgi:hypothetical protein